MGAPPCWEDFGLEYSYSTNMAKLPSVLRTKMNMCISNKAFVIVDKLCTCIIHVLTLCTVFSLNIIVDRTGFSYPEC